MKTRRLWPVVLASIIGFAILVSLGLWQVQRLKWKTALLADIAAREAAAPVSLAEAEQRRAAGDDLEFLKVTAHGHFLHDQEHHMLSTLDGGPAWDIVTPLQTDDGKVVLVDRGAVPDGELAALRQASPAPQGTVDVTGLIKMHRVKPTMFTPNNNASANQWIWWDMPALAATTKMPAGTVFLPYVLHVIPGGPAYPPIEVVEPASGIPNNHLQYVVTWFGLALALVAVAGVYIRGLMKKPDA